jgi:hypothetical protein
MNSRFGACAGLAAMVLAAMIVVGCAPWSNYPPLEADGNMATGELEPFPTLMADAILHVDSEYGSNAPIVYNLPAGATDSTERRVAQRIGTGEPLQRAGEPAIHVKAVRARGLEAQVDLLHPRSDGLVELVTVYFENDLGQGWHVVRDRRWRIPEEAPAPSAGSAVVAEEVDESAPDAP